MFKLIKRVRVRCFFHYLMIICKRDNYTNTIYPPAHNNILNVPAGFCWYLEVKRVNNKNVAAGFKVLLPTEWLTDSEWFIHSVKSVFFI